MHSTRWGPGLCAVSPAWPDAAICQRKAQSNRHQALQQLVSHVRRGACAKLQTVMLICKRRKSEAQYAFFILRIISKPFIKCEAQS